MILFCDQPDLDVRDRIRTVSYITLRCLINVHARLFFWTCFSTMHALIRNMHVYLFLHLVKYFTYFLKIFSNSYGKSRILKQS